MNSLAKKSKGRIVFLFCGSDALKVAEPIGDRLAHLVLPPNTSPYQIDWRPVADRDVLMFPVGEISVSTLRKLSGCLAKAGAYTVNLKANW